MEKRVKSIVFRRLSQAEFDHIYHAGSHYANGGGQAYIDFPTSRINTQIWTQFLGANTGTGAGNRSFWTFTINSLGVANNQEITIRHRRAQSVSVTAQKITGQSANRVLSWHPNNGFPTIYSPNIIVYIVKTFDDEYWAGWFEEAVPPPTWSIDSSLLTIFTEPSAGYIKLNKKLFITTTNLVWPFHFNAESITNDIPTEEDLETNLELQDTSPRLQELIEAHAQPEFVNRIMRIRQRNKRLVQNLKNLYGGRCQLTGELLTFLKPNGQFYSEVHHLIPLGEDGSDSYNNAIVVSPLIHRMLHYATVSPINLNEIVDNRLTIQINGNNYEIQWHPEHLAAVNDALSN